MNIRRLINVLFPLRCAICDEPVYGEIPVCPKCAASVRCIEGDTCIKCGKVLKDSEKMTCYDCSRKIHSFDRGFSVFEYQDIKKSLYRFKYAGRAEYGAYYAFVTQRYMGRVISQLNASALVPVPIHRKRMAARGYNQAEVFAKELSRLVGIPVRSDLIFRTKATVPMKKLSESERKNNLKKAFIIAPNVVKLKSIIIIDDIYTTGSTMDAVASLFKEAGVEKVYFITVAIGAGL